MDAMRMNQGNVSQYPIVEEEPIADVSRMSDVAANVHPRMCDGIYISGK